LLTKANVASEAINAVEVIGGGVRSPIIQARLKSALNKDLGFSLDSAHCISIGAALFGKSKHPEYGFQYNYDDGNSTTYTATIDTAQLEVQIKEYFFNAIVGSYAAQQTAT
jgi:molecular chaperone DnaK (HSP70)